MQTKKIRDLKAYHKNPRKISKEDFDLLASSLKEFGDLSGIIVNRTSGEVVGGNQRTNFFKQEPDQCEIVILEEYETPKAAGTVAIGFVMYNGEKYGYREVEWDEKKEERANILANKVGGSWDFDILGNSFDIDLLLDSGWKGFELGFATTKEQDGEDENPLEGSMETYLKGNVKQITVYLSSEEYDDVVTRLDKIMGKMEVKSHTDVFLNLLKHYEDNQS